MICGQDADAAVTVKAAAELADRDRRVEQVLSGRRTKTDEKLGTDDLELPVEERPAIGSLRGKRRSVSRRTTLEDIQDVDIFSLHLARFDNAREQLASSPHERLALLVLVGSRRLPQETKPGHRVADAEHRLRAVVDQLEAARARCHLLTQLLEGRDPSLQGKGLARQSIVELFSQRR